MRTDQTIPCPPRPVEVVSGCHDGWIGAAARVCVHWSSPSGTVRLQVKYATPEVLLPVVVIARVGERQVDRLKLDVDSCDGTLVLPLESGVQDEFVHFDLEVTRTFVPREFDPQSRDSRSLGVLVVIDE